MHATLGGRSIRIERQPILKAPFDSGNSSATLLALLNIPLLPWDLPLPLFYLTLLMVRLLFSLTHGMGSSFSVLNMIPRSILLLDSERIARWTKRKLAP